MAAAVAYVATVTSATDLTTYTFVGAATGTAGADRVNAVGIRGGASVSPNTAISSVTINGVSAANRASAAVNAALAVEIWDAANPTDTTGDIVVVFGQAQNHAVVVIWEITGAAATPTDTDSNTSASANSLALTALTVDTDGFAVLFWTIQDSSAGVTWTGATEDVDAAIESRTYSGAHTTTAGTNTITADGQDSSRQSIVGVAYGPATPPAGNTYQFFAMF